MPNFSEPGPLTLSPAILSMLGGIPPYDARGHYAAPVTSNATHPAYVTVEDLATCLPAEPSDAIVAHLAEVSRLADAALARRYR